MLDGLGIDVVDHRVEFGEYGLVEHLVVVAEFDVVSG